MKKIIISSAVRSSLKVFFWEEKWTVMKVVCTLGGHNPLGDPKAGHLLYTQATDNKVKELGK